MRPWTAALLVLAVVVPQTAHPDGNTGVTVDAYTTVDLCGQTQITSNLFGLTAFEGFPSVVANRDYRSRVQALRPGCFRLPGCIAWCAPPTYDPSWYETAAAEQAFSQVLLFGDRYPLGRFLPVVRQMGAEPMCSLGAPPPYLMEKGTNHPSDFDRWAEYCARYVGLWRKFDPGFRLVQIWNEPNASWYKDPRANDKGTTAADLHIQMANKVARAIKQRFPDIRIGGPVLCWPPAWPPGQQGLRPWYTWEMWTLPWLRDTKDTVDFYDFHVYNVTPEDFAVQTEMLFNQALLTQGRRLPVWITESSTDLKPEELKDPKAIWTKRILPYERLLLRGMLPQADKVEGNLYHDLSAKNHTLLPDGADHPDPTYWLFWILRDLRGRRVVADSTDPEVVAYSTLEEDRVTVALFNDSDSPKDVPLKVAMPCGYWTGPEVRAIGESREGDCQRMEVQTSFERHGNSAQGILPLPARATLSLSFRLDRFSSPSRLRAIQEYFGDRTLQFLQGTKPVQTTVALPKVTNEKAGLRLGLLGPMGTESVGLRLNGRDLNAKAARLQDIPVDPATLKTTNKVEVWLRDPVDNPKLALGFVSLVIEGTR